MPGGIFHAAFSQEGTRRRVNSSVREPSVEQNSDLDENGDDEHVHPDARSFFTLPFVHLALPQMTMMGKAHFDFSRRCLGTGRGSEHFGGGTGAIARQLSHGYFVRAL